MSTICSSFLHRPGPLARKKGELMVCFYNLSHNGQKSSDCQRDAGFYPVFLTMENRAGGCLSLRGGDGRLASKMRQIGAPRAVHGLHPYISQDEGKTAKNNFSRLCPLTITKQWFILLQRRIASGDFYPATNPQKRIEIRSRL